MVSERVFDSGRKRENQSESAVFFRCIEKQRQKRFLGAVLIRTRKIEQRQKQGLFFEGCCLFFATGLFLKGAVFGLFVN